MRVRHENARDRDRAHEFERIEFLRARERRALDLHQFVDRHALGMLRQRCQALQEFDAILARLAHADDAAAADVHARGTHGIERVEPVLIGARRDDLAVERFGGVEIVVVVVESGRLERSRLLVGQHAERRAGLEPERAHLAHHRDDGFELPVLGRAIRGAHAEARRAGRARGARTTSRRPPRSAAPRARRPVS